MQQEKNSEESRPRPSPPPPSATHAEVRAFVADYLLFLGYAKTEDEAKKQAGRRCLSGASLYTLPDKQWRIDYGNAGYEIFWFLRNSKFGSLSSMTSGPFFKFFSKALTYSESFFEEKKSSAGKELQVSSSSSPSSSQQDHTFSNCQVRPTNLSSGNTSQTKSTVETQQLTREKSYRYQQDGNTLRSRRLYSKDTD